MCTRDEVNKIVSESEKRIVALVHEEIAKLRKEVRTDRENSHMALSKTISNLGGEFIKAVQELKDWRKDIETDINGLKLWQSEHNIEAKFITEKIDSIFSVGRWLLTVAGSALVLQVLNLIFV